MTDLIARLEAATEGSRELDYEILDLILPGSGVSALSLVDADHYTTNLDAALTLVPEGTDWDIGYLKDNGQVHAHVMFMAPAGEHAKAFECEPETEIHWAHTGRSPIPALALCIAALKARS